MANPNIHKIDASLYLVPLPVPIEGFSGFITSWIYTAGPVLLIDVGPSAAQEHLLRALAELGIHRPDAILLTHVHIDHSGAIGGIARAFPDTPVFCHPKAVAHVIDPQRLWEGSLSTLGEVARGYGPIEPVAAKQVRAADKMDQPGVLPIASPGHAAHHYSYMIGDVLFAGEAGGVCLSLGADRFYMRPATPPRFILETSLESIDRLLALKPGRICYGHVGLQPHAVERLRMHRGQLQRWHQTLSPLFSGAQAAQAEELLPACLEKMLAEDPLLAGFASLTPEAQGRERFFLMNSLRGYWGYIREGLKPLS